MKNRSSVLFIPEPTLTFRHGQAVEDPRDGLTLFGPLDAGKPYGIRAGVIGTAIGISYFKDWVQRIQKPLCDEGSHIARPPFPGFEAAFQIPWSPNPVLSIELENKDIDRLIHLDDPYQRVHGTVSLFSQAIQSAVLKEEGVADLWFVVVPDVIHELCRPNARVNVQDQVKAEWRYAPKAARRFRWNPSLYEEENRATLAYQYEVDFHNQLKARLLGDRIITQIVQESTLALFEEGPDSHFRKRDCRPFQAAIAWNIGTTTFYKAGGRPWKINGIRDGVCYIGLVFKRDATGTDPRLACCAAQMFLDSGDGIVFRGAIGPWYSRDTREFHLSQQAARRLVELAIETYKQNSNGRLPRELFLHGRASFADDEWQGFKSGIDPAQTNIVGVKIREDAPLRLYRQGKHPVLRGTAYIQHRRSAFLWTKGYAPRLRTYVGREVPRPLRIDLDRGSADIEVILSDIMALTKLNYNACILADGLPVTLRFANAIGEILTAGPVEKESPLPFKHYI